MVETIEKKKRRLAKELGIVVLSRGKKPAAYKGEDGKYMIENTSITSKIVGDKGLAKVRRLSGMEDIVVIRWDDQSGRYGICRDENAFEGRIVEFIALYGENSSTAKEEGEPPTEK